MKKSAGRKDRRKAERSARKLRRQEDLPGGTWHESPFTRRSLASRRIDRRPLLARARARRRANAARAMGRAIAAIGAAQRRAKL